MINTNLSVTVENSNVYSEGFGGSAYEQLVAHDNLMSEYVEADGYYTTIPYHAVDSVVITHSSSSHTVTDDLCSNG